MLRETEQYDHHLALVRDAKDRVVGAWVSRQLAERIEKGDEISFTGRFTSYGSGLVTFERLHLNGTPVVIAGASRLTGQTVAGLVVGAMGVFILAVALRHWLGERRAWREETESITPG